MIDRAINGLIFCVGLAHCTSPKSESQKTRITLHYSKRVLDTNLEGRHSTFLLILDRKDSEAKRSSKVVRAVSGTIHP
jgi:hypothetical protein